MWALPPTIVPRSQDWTPARRVLRIWLIVGVSEIERRPKLNRAWVFSADGTLIGEYHKRYFVRGFESGYEAGDRIYATDTPWGKTGVAICKDRDYHYYRIPGLICSGRTTSAWSAPAHSQVGHW